MGNESTGAVDPSGLIEGPLIDLEAEEKERELEKMRSSWWFKAIEDIGRAPPDPIMVASKPVGILARLGSRFVWQPLKSVTAKAANKVLNKLPPRMRSTILRRPVAPAPINPPAKSFPNQFPGQLAAELEEAASVGFRPIRIGDDAFEEVVNSGRIKYVVLEDTRELIIGQHSIGDIEISHAVLADGRNVLSAGEADIAGAAGEYVGIGITERSGHFLPDKESLAIAREVFSTIGILFPE